MRSLVRGLAVVSVFALVTLALLWITQRRLIYFPTQRIVGPPSHLPGVEEAAIPTGDGLSLAAWFIPAGGGERLGTVVVFNGNAGNRSDRTPLAASLAERGCSVLLVDYRGYGGNPGSPSEEGLAADARAAATYLSSRSDVDPDTVAYFGESLGAAVAIGLAATHPPAALVLRSPFTSLADMGRAHYPFVPVSLLLRDRYENLETIAGIPVPTLVIAGSADTIVPVGQSQALFQAAPGPKRLVIIDGADHNDFALTAGDQVVAAVVSFLEEALGDV